MQHALRSCLRPCPQVISALKRTCHGQAARYAHWIAVLLGSAQAANSACQAYTDPTQSAAACHSTNTLPVVLVKYTEPAHIMWPAWCCTMTPAIGPWLQPLVIQTTCHMCSCSAHAQPMTAPQSCMLFERPQPVPYAAVCCCTSLDCRWMSGWLSLHTA
jgi:hypothetical protein